MLALHSLTPGTTLNLEMAVGQVTRACRAFTHTVSLVVVHIVNGHGYLQRHERDQLPFI